MKRSQLRCIVALSGIVLASAAWGADSPKNATGNVAPKGQTEKVAPAKPTVEKTPAAKDTTLADALIPPEMVAKAATQIGLDPQITQQVRAIVQDVRLKLEDAQQKLRTDTLALNDMVKMDRPDTQACLAQLDMVLEDERMVKRLNMEASLKVRELLTADQLAQIKALRNQPAVKEKR